MLNKVMIIGNLGQDPALNNAASGPIANLSIATTMKWKAKDGSKQEKTEWHRVSLFGKLAEVAGDYLKKGSKVYLEGRLQTRKWEDKNGVERYTTEIIGSHLQMLGTKSSQQSNDSPAKASYSHDKKYDSQLKDDNFDDDIPF